MIFLREIIKPFTKKGDPYVGDGVMDAREKECDLQKLTRSLTPVMVSEPETTTSQGTIQGT